MWPRNTDNSALNTYRSAANFNQFCHIPKPSVRNESPAVCTKLKFVTIGLPISALSVEIGGEGRDSNPPDGMTHRGRRTGHCLSHQRPLHCYHKLAVGSSTRITVRLVNRPLRHSRQRCRSGSMLIPGDPASLASAPQARCQQNREAGISDRRA